MSLFFGLLPADLQVHILHSWIHNDKDDGLALLKALSALDVAACGKACRADCRHLLSQIPSFGERSPGVRDGSIGLIANFIQWLDARKVAVRTLLLTRRDAHLIAVLEKLCLPSVEYISISDYSTSSELVEAALRACPNVVCLELGGRHLAHSFGFRPAMADHAPKLSSIILASAPTDAQLESMLSVFGSQLQELRMPNWCAIAAPMVQLIGEQCPLLQTLETGVFASAFPQYVGLLQTCGLLTNLILHSKMSSELDARVITEIATTSAQLKQFTVKANVPVDISCACFVAVRELRPDLEHLEIGEWRYTATDSHLRMQLGLLGNQSAMTREVLKCCPSVKEFSMCGSHMDVEAAETTVEHLQGRMQVLSVLADDSRSPEILVRKFGICLKHFSIGWKGGETDDLLRLVGSQCPLLESIAVINHSPPNSSRKLLSDEGIICLLTACSNLKSVMLYKLPTTAAVLQAIIKNRLRLEGLKLLLCGLPASHAEWFRQQVKEHELLPMPVLNIYSV